MKIRLLIPFWLLGALPALAEAGRSASDYGYAIKPVKPHFEQDAPTTFLAEAGEKALRVVFAAGAAKATAENGEFVPDGGMRGAFEVPAAGNFNPGAWTLEMLFRIPAGLQGGSHVTLLKWSGADAQGSIQGSVDSLACQIQGTGKSRFKLRCAIGGNGHGIEKDAAGRWIYLACGLDAKLGRLGCIVRELDGGVLAKRMEFVGEGCDSNVEPKDPAQDAGRLAACTIERLLFGGPEVEIKSLRLSKVFRKDILLLEPKWPIEASGDLVFSAEKLDPKRALLVTLPRRIGYHGYNNFRTPIREEYVLPMAARDAFEIKLPALKTGLYTFYVHGSIEPQGRKELERVWQPCPLRFQLKDAGGKSVAFGNLLLKQAFFPRLMQAFHFHIAVPGDYTAAFELSPLAQEQALIGGLVLQDRLRELPDVAIKTSQNLGAGPATQLTALSAERKSRDEAIWNALPPLNVHLQVHAQVKEFSKPPEGVALGTWGTKAFDGISPYHLGKYAFAPLDFVNKETKDVFPAGKILAGEPWPGEYPDDGTGIFLSKKAFPNLAHDRYFCPRAELLGKRYLVFVGALNDHEGYSKQATAYFEKGDPNDGHDAALALVRLAYDWPALEMTYHEIRLCTHAPDFEFNKDWTYGGNRNGKYYYRGWSGGNTEGFLTAYDHLFPYIKDNQLFAGEVARFIPWIEKPEDVIRLLDRYLVFSSVRDSHRNVIDAEGGVENLAAQVLGPHELTKGFFDLTQQPCMLHPISGRFQEVYATGFTRSGVHYIGSFLCYAFGEAEGLLARAAMLADAKKKGIELKMDISNTDRYPKIRKAADFLVDMFVAGGFPMMIGDASGGPHTGAVAQATLRNAKKASLDAFQLFGDRRHAWLLKNLHGSTDPAVEKAAEGVPDPILHNPSRVLAGVGAAVVEEGVAETELARKTAMVMRLGIGIGHAHADYLDINFFAHGLPVAVDLACRSEGNNWSRPHAAWAMNHNHAIAHDDLNPKTDQQSGEAWLRGFAPPLIRGSYVDAAGKRLDRDVMLMEIGETGQYYAFDLQRLKGGKFHTWSFHGCESSDLNLNVPMEAQATRWTDRTLSGSQKAGVANATLQAVWTMTRAGRELKHDFDGGGTLKLPGCEPAVLGKRFDPAQPEVHVRATLLGRQGDKVLQGSPYSQSYSYCFPFLWVQREAQAEEAVYPALYEWYRGDAPLLASVQETAQSPLTVKVVTTSGQMDLYSVKDESFSAVSRDAQGIRWAKLNGAGSLVADGIAIQAAAGKLRAEITDLDYARRTLTLSGTLPDDPLVTVGSDGHWICLQLKGRGNAFGFDDDLLVHEGEITALKPSGAELMDVTLTQQLLFAGSGNRKLEAFTMTNEDATWRFRGFHSAPDNEWKGGQVVRKPEGGALSEKVFTDANGDGLLNLKTYEIGIGDTAWVYTDVTLRRNANGYEVLTNAEVEIEVGGAKGHLMPAPGWQKAPLK